MIKRLFIEACGCKSELKKTVEKDTTVEAEKVKDVDKPEDVYESNTSTSAGDYATLEPMRIKKDRNHE